MSLTTEELSLLRNEAVVWMPDRCDIFRLNEADDAFGGRGVAAETPYLSNVPCSIDTGAGHEQILSLFGFQRDATTFIVYLPAETDVETTDHLVITTKGNEHMQVKAVMEPETHEVERMVIANSLAEHHP